MGSRVFPMGDFGGGGGVESAREGVFQVGAGAVEWSNFQLVSGLTSHQPNMLIPLSSKKAPPTKLYTLTPTKY